jgi:hypothetical protein
VKLPPSLITRPRITNFRFHIQNPFLSPKSTVVSNHIVIFGLLIYLSGGWPDLTIDLIVTVQRQINFVDKVVPLMIPGGLVEDKTNSGGRKPHVKFMALM